MDSALNDLTQAAVKLWQSYLASGPGTLPTDALREFLAAKVRLPVGTLPGTVSQIEFDNLVVELEQLLRRCVERTEGLCFVTGEAGLIPRRDLHERCEDLIAQLQFWCSASK